MRHCKSILHMLNNFIILSFFLLSFEASATFRDELSRFRAGQELLSTKAKILTDIEREKVARGESFVTSDRAEEAQQVLNTLIRIKGKAPVLMGAAGVGKTAVVQKVAQMIAQNQLPSGRVYREELSNAEIIKIEASALKLLGKKPDDAALNLVELVKQIEQTTHKPVILFIDEIHSVDSNMWDVFKTAMEEDGKNGLKIIGASTEKEFSYAFGADEAMIRRFAPIGVQEFTEEKTIKLIKASWKEIIEKRYDVEFSDEVIEKVVKLYKKILPDVARPDGPIKVLTDIAIASHEKNNKSVEVSDLYSFIQKRTKLPADPQNIVAINELIEEKRELLKKIIKGQDRMIDEILSSFRSLLLSSGDKPISVVQIGTTGIGKTYVGESIADALYDGKHRFFKIDGAAFADRSVSLTGLLGARPGSNGYKETMGGGSLSEWMKNPGKGKFGGVLFVDEIEKMNPDTSKELLMNLLDNGAATEGTGKELKIPNLLILASTNHGVNQIFPEGYGEWSEAEIDKRIQSYGQKDLKDLFTQPTTADDNYKLPKELINRFSKLVIARPLNFNDAMDIARLEIEKRKKIYLDRNKMKIEVSDEVVRFITEQVYSKEDGVRDVNRAIETFFSEVSSNAGKAKDIKVELNKTGSRKKWTLTVIDQNNLSHAEIQKHSFQRSAVGFNYDDVSDLTDLESRVNKEIYGQEEMVADSIKIIKNWRLFPTGRPLTVITVGTTGTGKTETPKVLAREIFGSESKAQVVAMGDIGRVENMTKIFGASPQYVKSDQMGLLEKALIQIKDGGFLILDEISNVGGGDPVEQEKILFMLYNMIEEGFWISPNTGRKYSFANIVVWMTGNNLQEEYLGISNDDQRLAKYNKIKNQAIVRARLRSKGFPEALLGRAQLVQHTKPLLEANILNISKRTVDNSLNKIKKRFPNLEIVIPDSVIAKLSQIFFDHDQGARSLRNKFESEVEALLTESILESKTNEDNAGSRKIVLSVQDVRSRKNYYIPGLKEEFKLKVLLVDKEKSKIIDQRDNDLLKSIDHMKPHMDELVKVAFHEIGHALLNDVEASGQILRFLTIKPGSSGEGKNYLGYAAYDEIKHKLSGVDELRKNLIRIVAGKVSQEVAGFTSDRGWTSDYQKMRSLIGEFYIRSGLNEELWGASLDKNGNIIGSEEMKLAYEKIVKGEIRLAQREAHEFLTKNYGLVRYLVAQLIKKQSLTGEEFYLHKNNFTSKNKAKALMCESVF